MIRTSTHRLAVLVVALAASAGAARGQELAPAEQYRVRLEYLYWSPEPTGLLQKGFSDSEGTLLDAQADLGITSSAANQLRGSLRLGTKWRLRGSWSRIDFRGQTDAVRTFSYGNTVVLSGHDVRTSLKGNYGSVDLQWDAVATERGFLGLLAGAKIFDVDTLLLDVDTESRVAETQRLPVPVLGVTGRAYVSERVSVEGEFSGLSLGDRGHVWEWAIAGRFHVGRRLAGTLGYRKIGLEGRDDRDSVKIDMGRWTIGAELSL